MAFLYALPLQPEQQGIKGFLFERSTFMAGRGLTIPSALNYISIILEI